MNVLALIPARGGSKGLPGKNLRPLDGMPLIGHSIRCALAAQSVTRVVVSTDSREIAAAAREHGADVPFMRPAELATDTAAMWPVVKHALDAVEAPSSGNWDAVVLLDPTSPGRLPSEIDAASARLASPPACDGVIGVSEPEAHPYWHFLIERDGYLEELQPGGARYARRQDLPSVFRINAALYAWTVDFVRQASDWRVGRLVPLLIPSERAWHVDTPAQFALLELAVESGLVQFPWAAGARE